MLARLGLMALLLIPTLSVSAGETSLEGVLDKLVESYGGEENLRKADHLIQQWDLISLMGNRPGTDIRSLQLPGRLRVDLTYPDKTETRVLDGEAAHVIFNGAEPALASPPQRDAMRLQMMRLYSPLALRERIASLSLTEESGLLALTLQENGVRADYLVNTDEWRIEKVVGSLSFNGMGMQFLTEYSDFREVDGVLVHHKENKFAGNVNTARLELRSIEFGADLQGRFKP